MEQFDTTRYILRRKEDGTIVRVFGNGYEEPELQASEHRKNEEYHRMATENSAAQAEKVEAFELENPLPTPEDVELEESA